MKRLIPAALALSLLGGAAVFAQETPPAPAPDAGMTAAAPPATGGDSMSSGQMAPSNGQPTAPAADPTAPAGSMSTGSMPSDTTAAPPPSEPAAAPAPMASGDTTAAASTGDYPPCSRTVKDRCRQGGKMAEGGMMKPHKHMMRHHRMKKMSSGAMSAPTTTAPAPATAPGA